MNLISTVIKERKWPFYLTILIVLFQLWACDKDADAGFSAAFSYEFLNDNLVKYTNLSEGEYYSLEWDFGNGETNSSIEKSKTFEIYYPQKGEYTVQLSVLNYSGVVKTSTQNILISKTDLDISFTLEVDPIRTNYVKLQNLSTGNYDSFKWLYRDKEIENEENTLAYFPFSGSHQIELQMQKGDLVYSQKQTVFIAQDDPAYLSTFVLKWADEFDGPLLNSEHWTFQTGSGGWGNNELQNYTNGDNASIENGILKLSALKVDNKKVAGSYTSSRIVTRGKKEFTYGRMEIRAKLPSGRGIWPAIWMLGANLGTVDWPACGEIDILEYVGYEPNTIHSTVHTLSGSGINGNGSSKILSTAEEEFHIYGVIWTEKEMVFYTDTPQNVTHTYAPASKDDANWPFYKPQFFIINVAVGGNWGGAMGIDNTIFPQSLEIDYVRVYQSEL